MVKKRVWFLLFFALLVLIYGCNTLSGTVEGMKKDFQAAKKIDDWMRENLW